MSKEEIEEIVAAQESKSHISCLGVVAGAKKAEIFAHSDIFLLPTSYPTEAAPISIIEALAAGCYVISTRQGAIPDLVDGFDAAITNPDVQEISCAIMKFQMRRDRHKVAERNRALAEKRYSLQAYQENIRGLFDEH